MENVEFWIGESMIEELLDDLEVLSSLDMERYQRFDYIEIEAISK